MNLHVHVHQRLQSQWRAKFSNRGILHSSFNLQSSTYSVRAESAVLACSSALSAQVVDLHSCMRCKLYSILTIIVLQ